MIAIQTTNNYKNEKCYISPSSHKNNEKKRRRVVHFSPIVYVKSTISLNDDMTEEEIAKTWIQEEDEYQLRKRCRELIACADNHSSKSCNYCMRGLESHTKHGKIRKDRNQSF
mmetsp:Transcript_3520/g.3994  ORF Transcript_3520/g.3994 Transcript_3520/m.3994 type:complete len:113 (-) Transcript_3520:187-525(-)